MTELQELAREAERLAQCLRNDADWIAYDDLDGEHRADAERDVKRLADVVADAVKLIFTTG